MIVPKKSALKNAKSARNSQKNKPAKSSNPASGVRSQESGVGRFSTPDYRLQTPAFGADTLKDNRDATPARCHQAII